MYPPPSSTWIERTKYINFDMVSGQRNYTLKTRYKSKEQQRQQENEIKEMNAKKFAHNL